MPASYSLLFRCTPPEVGDIIFGDIEEDGPDGPRFNWWNFATAQDRNFANLLTERVTFSEGKLEKKLVVKESRGRNWTLFLLAKALHLQNETYFADMIHEHGERPRILNLPCPLLQWLARHVEELRPGFCNTVRERIAHSSVIIAPV